MPSGKNVRIKTQPTAEIFPVKLSRTSRIQVGREQITEYRIQNTEGYFLIDCWSAAFYSFLLSFKRKRFCTSPHPRPRIVFLEKKLPRWTAFFAGSSAEHSAICYLLSVFCNLSSVICNLFLQKTVDTHQIFVHNALVCFLSSENTHGRPSRYHRWQRPRQKRPGNPCAARAGPRSRLWRQHYYAPRKGQRPRTWWARAVGRAHSCFKR